MRLAIAFLFVVTWTAGQTAGAGPSPGPGAALGSGFDYASACARPYRSSRARGEPAAPCDLTKQTYCTTPGTGYPWHAIRRFVRENQGLMRRMYGEERHISILKAELENYIEDDDDEDMKSDFADELLKTKMKYTKTSHGRAMKDKPHFRPIQSVDRNKKIDNDTLKVRPLQNTINQTKLNTTNGNTTEVTSNETMNDDQGISYKTKLESIANIEINNLEPDVITLEAVIKQSIETNSIYPKYSGDTKIEASKNMSNDHDQNVTTTENFNSTETTTSMTYDDDVTTDSVKDAWRPMNPDTSTLPPTLLFSEHEKEKVKTDKGDTKSNEKKEEMHPKPVQHQESVRPSVIKLRGANACEAKEQIAAPFWANSTRGEVLALLNMYPFEQYIHLETCVHERKQMYCREGCRCEQQFRLHRLLAYDPRNECRGIFADWFKFPACCVCKCYDVPLEVRARSPRIMHPQYGERVRRLLYDDVARDWYSIDMYEDDDLFD